MPEALPAPARSVCDGIDACDGCLAGTACSSDVPASNAFVACVDEMFRRHCSAVMQDRRACLPALLHPYMQQRGGRTDRVTTGMRPQADAATSKSRAAAQAAAAAAAKKGSRQEAARPAAPPPVEAAVGAAACVVLGRALCIWHNTVWQALPQPVQGCLGNAKGSAVMPVWLGMMRGFC